MRGLFLLILASLGTHYYSIGQNLSGQWRGYFNSAGNVVTSESNTEYVLEINIHGAEVSGYSYSYFDFPYKKYYVICRLEGTYNAAEKSIVVNEEERIKGNTPPDWVDCLQTHILTFLKQGDTEKLVGRWRPFKSGNGCGTGSTELERKMLTKITPPKSSPDIAKKITPVIPPKNNSTQHSLAEKPKPGASAPVTKKPSSKPINPVVKNTRPKTGSTDNKPIPIPNQPLAKIPDKSAHDSTIAKKNQPELVTPTVKGFERRSLNVLKTIEVASHDEIKVDFYDNGEIDGDTISVFFNGKLILSKQRLTDKPLSVTIKLDPDREVNDLVMYADNLGSIPPNTALMIAVIDGKRNEVYISSTEKSSGTIRFRRKE
ncbi:MAG: hypothetical protein JST63_02280 [Bacteroidetes bacterium]|nr:hypothetical protein [Bacteroidota bacterium]